MTTPCKKNKDCASNVCEMIYENDKPKGRFCIGSDNKYTIKCNVNKDCKSGICEKIYDDRGNFLVKKCVKAPKIDDDSAYNTLFGKKRTNKYGNINGNAIKLIADDGGPITEIIIKVIDLIFNIFNIIVFNFNACNDSKADAREKCQDFLLNYKYKDEYGVVKKVDGDSIDNYRYAGVFKPKCERRCVKEKYCSCNPMTEQYHQAIIYGIWRSVFDGVFNAFGGSAGGWIFAPSSALYHTTSKKDSESGNAPQCKKNSYGVDLWYFRTVITILFPPFGVLLAKGINGFFQIIISCVLTCLFYFPGLIYSFAVINSSPLDLRELKGFEKIYAENTNRQDYLNSLKKTADIVQYDEEKREERIEKEAAKK